MRIIFSKSHCFEAVIDKKQNLFYCKFNRVNGPIFRSSVEFMADKNKKSEKKKSKNLEIAYGLRDPAIASTVRVFLIFLVAVAFAISIVTVFFAATANAHGGFFYNGGKYTVELTNPQTGLVQKEGAVIKETSTFKAGDVVGYVFLDSDATPAVCLKTIETVSGKDVKFVGDGNLYSTDSLLGVYEKSVDSSFILAIIDDPVMMVLFTVIFMVLSVIAALVYFLVSPRGAKKYEKKDEKTEIAAPVIAAISSDNASLMMQYISADDNIQPLEQDENVLPGSVNTNYYGSVRLRDGEVYTVVKKYTEVVPTLEEFGASDMDIIKMNMVGNAEFENLVLLPHKEKTMTMEEVIDYTASLDGVYCIKKRGTLNWVYKYKTKTILIVKENDDHSGFKVSVKVYPDAAYKLNIIYKSLEDSTFPIGPFWYMFNNLRNLPGNVIKWLISESYKISKWQQVRADILRDTQPLEHYGYDVLALRSAVLSGTKVKEFDKFAIITQTVTPENKYRTVLETGFDGIDDMDKYTKEFTMVVPQADNLSFSMLAKKNASEALINSFCNEMPMMCVSEVPAAREENAEAATRIVRRSATVKKIRK